MNQNFNKIFLSVILVVLGLLVFVSMMSSGGNVVGNAALYMSIFSFAIGLLVPRASAHLLLILAGYSDLFKRFLVLDTTISQLDLVYVLAMAPLSLAGIVLGLLIGGIFRLSLTKLDLLRFAACTGVLLLVTASVLLSGGGLRGLRVIADYGAFVYLCFALPILFNTRESLLRYAKVALIIFIPVALYGIWQRVYGLSTFELDYLDTGLSIETRQLRDIAFRPFSTLNAASSLTMVCAACVLLSCVLIKQKVLLKFTGIILILLYATACIMTFTRTGWACVIVAPFIVVAFRYRVTTLLFYFGGAAAFLTLVLSSSWILANLPGWQADLTGEGDSGRETQAFRVTTLQDRFIGFDNLKNPDNWQPFGIKVVTKYGENRFDDTAFSHDAISSFIFRRGYIPAVILALCGLVFCIKLHFTILQQSMSRRKYSTLLVGSCVALLVSLLAGGYVFQFPANIFLWLMACLAANSLSDDQIECDEEGALNDQ